MRQWSTSSSPLSTPMTVWVLPTSTASSTSHLLGAQVEAEVEHGRGVSQGADRKVVHSGLRDLARAFEGKAAAGFQPGSAIGDADALAQLVGGHVVEQQ